MKLPKDTHGKNIQKHTLDERLNVFDQILSMKTFILLRGIVDSLDILKR